MCCVFNTDADGDYIMLVCFHAPLLLCFHLDSSFLHAFTFPSFLATAKITHLSEILVEQKKIVTKKF